jgi:acetoin utilization deacetylase AcuC-like enzyme
MRAYYHDQFVLPLPPGHRFPIAKYGRLRERLIEEGVLPPSNLQVSPAASDGELLRVHSADYVHRVVAGELTDREVRRIGFPWSPELVERSRRSVGGTIAATRAAHAEGVAANLAGGTHHADVSRGAGFCVFNDVAVASRTAQAEGLAERVLLLDCDVHQGDGSARLFADDPSVFTFSIHGARNFPFNKAHSDLDVALPDGTGDEPYLAALRLGAERALTQAKPDLVIYLAGADPYRGDALGRLALSKDGLQQRDQWVLTTLAEFELPTVVVMGGGYAKRVDDIVDIHLSTVLAAIQAWSSLPRNTAQAVAGGHR